MYEYKIQVTRVLDGDTVDGIIDLGYKTYVRKRIRFLGFNAPETRTRDKEEKIREINKYNVHMFAWSIAGISLGGIVLYCFFKK